MNLFRLLGDGLHLASFLILLLRLRVAKNAIGISMKTQELYLLVFVTRYLDLFGELEHGIRSWYLAVMKCLYIGITAYILFLVRKTEPYKSIYDHSQDTFRSFRFAIAPCIVLAIITSFWNGKLMSLYTPWIFSEYLEAIAFVPQFMVLQRHREVENLTSHYVFSLGAYRALYIFNWVYRSWNEIGYEHNWIMYICGTIQTLLFIAYSGTLSSALSGRIVGRMVVYTWWHCIAPTSSPYYPCA